MKILEHSNGKITAEIESKYPTRVVYSAGRNFLDDWRPEKPSASRWPIRMNTQAYKRDMDVRHSEATKILRKEVEAKNDRSV